MARAGVINSTKMLLAKPFSGQGLAAGGLCMSKSTTPNHCICTNNTKKVVEGPPAAAAEEQQPESWWVPHPRTGIYFPKGQESVMEDIPNDAASFESTFWFRSIDGVDYHKPDPNHT